MAERTCPHCGNETPAYADGHWRHVRMCSKNPDPACPKCGIHFKEARLARHVERCRKTPASPEAAPEAAGSPAADDEAGGGVLEQVPPERRTPTDELILPLIASPSKKPDPPAPAKKAKRAPTGRAKAAGTPAPQAPVVQSSGSAPAPAPEKGLGAAFDQRDPPRTAAFAGLGESLKNNWVLLAIIAIGLVLVVLWRRMSKNTEQAAAPPQAAAAPVLASRPPYNPEVHGSVEQFLAKYGHLPAGGGA